MLYMIIFAIFHKNFWVYVTWVVKKCQNVQRTTKITNRKNMLIFAYFCLFCLFLITFDYFLLIRFFYLFFAIFSNFHQQGSELFDSGNFWAIFEQFLNQMHKLILIIYVFQITNSSHLLIRYFLFLHSKNPKFIPQIIL